MLKTTATSGFGAGGGLPDATVSFVTSTQSSANATSYTFSSQSLGTAAANRTIVIGCATFGPGATNCIITSATLGGSTMTIENHANDSTIRASFLRLAYPTGTSADVVVNVTAVGYTCGIGIWACYGIGDYDDTSNAGYPSESTDINISAGGIAIGYAVNHNPTATVTWTNMTERFDDVMDYTSHSGADTSSATGANPTVTCDWPTRDSGPLLLNAWPKG